MFIYKFLYFFIFAASQNLDRLAKLNEKLNSIHINIETEKYSKYEEIEVKLNNLGDTHNDANEKNLKAFSVVKEQIAHIIKQLEDDKQEYEHNYENRSNYIRMLEFKIMERFEAESNDRKDGERGLILYIDEKFNILKNELSKEAKNRNDSIENFTFYLESEIPKIIEQMKTEQVEREEADNNISRMISEEFARLTMLISNEKKTREETEEAFLDMLRSVINKVKNELESEKREREKTEETLLTLLEETCSRLDEASRI